VGFGPYEHVPAMGVDSGHRRGGDTRVESGNWRDPDWSDIVTSSENPERARLRSSFLGVSLCSQHSLTADGLQPTWHAEL